MDEKDKKINLHPTMYLLIQCSNSSVPQCCMNLHPTMYLLIHNFATTEQDIVTNLHPTMYLLIPREMQGI